ncbi:unnamed protein product [Durusdinium trenchii]|uniref:Nicotinamide-nucleotide adenylyltransferase n=1 Tax=Durusdinium trenchii TaxID=1381693 RepID=A0ABP0R714_9DINO
MKSLALRPCGPLDTRTYVLVVSGTFNPPHRGHLRLGLFAKERLEKLGHQVEAVCFLPVHDNYMLNKQTLAAKSGSSGAEVFYPMAARCDFLRALLRREEPRTEAFCKVLDYEQQHPELLETSPNYWAKKLPEGYLRTVPTASLLRHVARGDLVGPGQRLGAVFGVDNLAGMSSWNAVGELLEDTDLILVAREMQIVEMCQDPEPLLGALKHFCLEERVQVKYKDQELLPRELGHFENVNSSGHALLLLLPALRGPDEHLSSTQLRKRLVELLASARSHGCDEELILAMLRSTQKSSQALEEGAKAARERGEGVEGALPPPKKVKPTLAAIPQFSMIGPVYLQFFQATDSRAAAVLAASFGESLLTFAPQRRNAQIQYNAARPAHQHIAITPSMQISGPGFIFHVWRNAVAMMGIRLFAPYTERVVQHLPTMDRHPETKAILSDLSASMISSVLSMPFNQVCSWAYCSPELVHMTQRQRLQAYATFLIGSYCGAGRLGLLGRDLMVRISYTSFLFTGYHIVERRMRQMSSGDR